MVDESEYRKNLRALGFLNIISIVGAWVAVIAWIGVIDMTIVMRVTGTGPTPWWGYLLYLIPVLAVPAYYVYSIIFSLKHKDEDNWKFAFITAIVSLVIFILVFIVILIKRF